MSGELDENNVVLLDAEDRSLSVAQARHLARVRMLLPALDELFELGMNRSNRSADRVSALKVVIQFASEAQIDGFKQASKLSPEAARLILKHGLGNVRSGDRVSDVRRVLPAEEEEARVVPGETDSDAGGPEGGGPE